MSFVGSPKGHLFRFNIGRILATQFSIFVACVSMNLNIHRIVMHSPPTDWTPSQIRGNPSLLLHKKAPNLRMFIDLGWNTGSVLKTVLALHAFDGKVGHVLDGIDSFIITPNSSLIPKPPLGSNREVYMQENFQYGHDNPLQWPQAYVEQFPHLACICWVTPANPKDTFHLLYCGLTKYDFVECDPNSLMEGVGLLHQSSFLKLQAACNVVVELMKSVDGSASVSHSMRGHLSVIELLLGHLHALPTSYLRICLTFAETQCVAL